MKKKGQITLFIILALVIIIGSLAYFVFKDKIGSSSLEIYSEKVSVYTADCIEKVSEEVILGVGQGGGYFYPPEFSTGNQVTYYYGPFGTFNFPSKEDIEKEVSKIVSEKLMECTNNFVDFIDYHVQSEGPEVEARISEEKIDIFVNYPIRIMRDEEIVLLEKFENTVKVRLGLIYDIINKMLEEEPLKKGICLTCNFEYSLENDLKIDYLDYDSTTTIFVIKDEELKINENSFEFIFANDYSEENGI